MPATVLLKVGAVNGVLFAAPAVWVGLRGNAEGAQGLAWDALRYFLCWCAAALGYVAIQWAVRR